ncbi:MAG: hypothetical protein ABIG95_06930 [Candidatus Woesearchaeota archaeon]
MNLAQKVGTISHYFSNIGVAVVELSNTLKVGDNIQIKGFTTDFTIAVSSMQIEHKAVQEAKAGQSIGMKVPGAVRQGDSVYKI